MTTRAITSLDNPRIKDAIRLRDARHRAKQGRFLIDGAREMLRALDGRVTIVEWFVCEGYCSSAESLEVLSQISEHGPHAWYVTPQVFDKLAFGQRHEGVLAIAETPRPTLADLAVPAGSLIAVIEGLEKPGNVGAVLRSADGAGVAAVIVADGGTDLYNPNCIRASLGTIFTQNVCEASTAETLQWLRGRGCRIFAARLDSAASYTAADYRGDVAIVLGREASGLSDAWQTADVTTIKLPMRGSADSLNVSATAAVIFYEALRQRDTAE